MLRVRIHNLLTDQRYEFTAADQAEIDARLERKVKVYGRRAWTEIVPPAEEGGEPTTVEHPAEHTVEVEVVDQRPERLARAWAAADAHARAGLDENSRSSLLWLAADPACPAWRRERILAVQAWWQAVWVHYGQVRESINLGVDTSFDPAIPGGCPWTIWQIAAEAP